MERLQTIDILVFIGTAGVVLVAVLVMLFMVIYQKKMFSIKAEFEIKEMAYLREIEKLKERLKSKE